MLTEKNTFPNRGLAVDQYASAIGTLLRSSRTQCDPIPCGWKSFTPGKPKKKSIIPYLQNGRAGLAKCSGCACSSIHIGLCMHTCPVQVSVQWTLQAGHLSKVCFSLKAPLAGEIVHGSGPVCKSPVSLSSRRWKYQTCPPGQTRSGSFSAPPWLGSLLPWLPLIPSPSCPSLLAKLALSSLLALLAGVLLIQVVLLCQLSIIFAAA